MPQLETKSLQEIISPVATEIEALNDRLINEISPSSRSLCMILQDIFHAGGKRLRPALSFLITKALGHEINEEIYLVAEISELIHTASLVHDDIIDNSLIRRGKETANSKWDNAITVISGDFMFARAAVNLGKLGINEITTTYAKVLEDLCDGEIRQVEKKFSTDLDFDYYYKKSYKKTASLFEASTKAAALALEAETEEITACAQYGEALGLAFQIIDDVLDFTADAKKLGKATLSDLKEGQVTLPVLFALETNNNLKAKIEKLSQDPENEELRDEILTTVKNEQGIERSIKKAKELAQEAIDKLEQLGPSAYKNSLIELANFTVNREL